MSEMLENLRVVLVAVRNPLNIGAAGRAMSNFGAMHLRVVNPYEKAWREARSAVGAGEVLARAEEFASVSEAVADCTMVVGTTAVGNREIRQVLRNLAEARPLIREQLAGSRVALLFGSEKWGLSNESLSYCHWLLRIPTREEHGSMNLGQAVAVCMYELGREEFTTERTEGPQSSRRREEVESSQLRVEWEERGERRIENRKSDAENRKANIEMRDGKMVGTAQLAQMETVERITGALLEALRTSGYVGKRTNELAEEKLRRMIRRFRLDENDAEVFLGMVRKILWKLEQK